MSKIGILSMQRIINYGSFLQAYALRSLLEGMGHEVQFVDYRPGPPLIREPERRISGPPAGKHLTPGPIAAPAGRIRKALDVLRCDAPLQQKIQYIQYKKGFPAKYHPALGIGPEPNYSPRLDVLVIGSDEVFNCIQQNPNVGYSPELFGAGHHADKLISFSASFGDTTLDALEKHGKSGEISTLLKQFDALSVRDRNSLHMVESLSGRTAQYHADPVLIYDFSRNIRPGFRPDSAGKYLLLYAYSGRITPRESEWILEYARKKDLKIYAIGGVHSCADRFIDCSPFELLSWFAGAEEVITDTFHGTIFSMITRKDFVSLIRPSTGGSYGNEEKLTDLLERFRLLDRGVFSVEDAERVLSRPADHDRTERLIREERLRAVEYLAHETGGTAL
ncbi:MAG TPA: polysaccharide pyruvyl transferase family protein [Candidatus Mediterraneibacter cottocaccae]|nr:polysaccharide pyruvyl transferase family protein [Candidatus Mediterraneibacter cottocaccae]